MTSGSASAVFPWGRWRLAGGHVFFSGALVVLLAASPAPGQFARDLPGGIPSGNWDKSSGMIPLDNGGGSLQYELYYRSDRSNYEIIRYRVTGWDGGGAGPYSSNERLQWHSTEKDLRRYECEPLQGGGCQWRELGKNTPEYRREMGMVLWVLSVHNRLLHAREEGTLPPQR